MSVSIKMQAFYENAREMTSFNYSAGLECSKELKSMKAKHDHEKNLQSRGQKVFEIRKVPVALNQLENIKNNLQMKSMIPDFELKTSLLWQLCSIVVLDSNFGFEFWIRIFYFKTAPPIVIVNCRIVIPVGQSFTNGDFAICEGFLLMVRGKSRKPRSGGAWQLDLAEAEHQTCQHPAARRGRATDNEMGG